MRITGIFDRSAAPRTGAPGGSAVRTLLAAALLAASALLGTATPATADETPSPSATATDDEEAQAPTEAGTSFRTATAFRPGQRATAEGSSGDYLYWVFPVDAGQRAAVTAKVKIAKSAAARKGSTTWQVDIYDGLRRRQPCVYGTQTKALAAEADTVEVRCVLRTVRSWAEPWSNDPLPGSYFVRLTVLNAQKEDLGLPISAEIEADTPDQGGAHAVDGKLSVPLTPGRTTVSQADGNASTAGAQLAASGVEPEGGWSGGWWTDRWLWTLAGAVIAALTGIAGYTLARPARSGSA
ncbi:hypothetical protein AB0O07_02240 [Streptomyces sp. NPDC093085]|uniref:hypothetical protein n=1 Tax=Streptomyces sp. NPDC093085 TaxID=3155068 RepID=UPI00342A107B